MVATVIPKHVLKKLPVKNSDLLVEIQKSRESGEVTKNLAVLLHRIAERYSYHPWFRDYSFREDMVAEATMNLCMNWHTFDETKMAVPNPFSYYTTAVRRSFLHVMAQEKSHSDVRNALLLEAGESASWNYENELKGSDDTAFRDAAAKEE